MKNLGGHFAPKLGGQFELELGGQYHWNLHTYVTKPQMISSLSSVTLLVFV
jgi:hypothetical protein